MCGLERKAEGKERMERIPIRRNEVEVFEARERR